MCFSVYLFFFNYNYLFRIGKRGRGCFFVFFFFFNWKEENVTREDLFPLLFRMDERMDDSMEMLLNTRWEATHLAKQCFFIYLVDSLWPFRYSRSIYNNNKNKIKERWKV
jgi:hypothetical protein